uniref:Acid phosphatase n=1 Tax=Solanum lycopersicum TaxID=4081 RepID=A0A3Q7HR12_SOLLC
MVYAHQNFIAVLFISFTFMSTSFSQSILKISPQLLDLFAINRVFRHRKIPNDDALYCDSWRFTVETNNAGLWSMIPQRCISFVQDYTTGDRYSSDSAAVADLSLAFANTVNVSNDGMDAWVFDIDETLLSNLPYYVEHGFGSQIFDEITFDKWVNEANAPAIPASLKLYKELQQRGFTIFLLTGRIENQRNKTERNMVHAGYSNWERLILRPDISFSTQTLSQFLQQPKRSHLDAVLRVIRYLKKQPGQGLLLANDSDGQVTAFCDADWASCPLTRKSVTGGPSDKGKLATEYKSEKRKELEDEGYRIRGNSGDQWSDLTGFAVAERSFKLPNPMYYIA